MYGSLATIIVFLVWLWISNLALLFGAELDSEVQRERAIAGGGPAAPGTLPSAARHDQTASEVRAPVAR